MERRQHVSIVLPHYLLEIEAVRDELLDLVCSDTAEVPSVDCSPDRPLLEALGQAMVYSETPPTALPDLLRHTDVAGRVWVLDAMTLADEQRTELPAFMKRVTLESKSIGGPDRATFVVVTGSDLLPRFAGEEQRDVTHAVCWYWNRMTRWDAAVEVASTAAIEHRDDPTVSEVRTEMIVELSRWDLDLAAELAKSWDGTVESFRLLARDHFGEPIVPDHSSERDQGRPPDRSLEAWNSGLVERWHGAFVAAPGIKGDREVDRCMWSAQARVLLPWIESKRNQLENLVRRKLKPEGFKQAVRHCSSQQEEDDDMLLVEIGLLDKVIRWKLGRTHPQWAAAARTLRKARNDLAHLRPMAYPAIQEMVSTLRFLE